MQERCLMLRPHMQTLLLLGGQDGGMPCTTSCRVPLIQTDERCPSRCPCPSCTSMLEGEKEMTQRTVTACPQPRGRPDRGTANLTHTTASAWKPFTMCRPIAGG